MCKRDALRESNGLCTYYHVQCSPLTVYRGNRERYARRASLFTELGTGKKIMADSLRYQALEAIGIHQHYCEIDISEIPPPNLSPPSLIATKAFAELLGIVAIRGGMLQCISQL